MTSLMMSVWMLSVNEAFYDKSYDECVDANSE